MSSNNNPFDGRIAQPVISEIQPDGVAEKFRADADADIDIARGRSTVVLADSTGGYGAKAEGLDTRFRPHVSLMVPGTEPKTKQFQIAGLGGGFQPTRTLANSIIGFNRASA